MIAHLIHAKTPEIWDSGAWAFRDDANSAQPMGTKP